jgi:uncharacterized protein (DUF736 family)
MAYEQKDDSGSLFKNDRKDKDTHADYRGSVLIGGDEFWLDAWINKDRNGGNYMSLKFKLKDATKVADNRPQPAAFDDDLDDRVPF